MEKKEHRTVLAVVFQLLFPYLGAGYWDILGVKRAVIVGAISFVTFLLLVILTPEPALILIVPLIMILTATHCGYLSCMKNKEIRAYNKRLAEKATKKKMMELAKEKEDEESHRKEMEANGFVFYKQEFITKEERARLHKIEAFERSIRNSNQYKGCFIECSDCGFIWKIKKDYGMPARCGKCNSLSISVDWEKSYSELHSRIS
jgi:hypothetical protein